MLLSEFDYAFLLTIGGRLWHGLIKGGIVNHQAISDGGVYLSLVVVKSAEVTNNSASVGDEAGSSLWLLLSLSFVSSSGRVVTRPLLMASQK